MSLTTSGTAHAVGSTPMASDGPFSIWGWFNPGNVGQFRRFFSILNSADSNQTYSIGTDPTGAAGNASAYTFESASSGTQAKGAVLTVGTWYFLGGSFTGSGQPTLHVNNNAKVTGGSGFNPTVNETVVSGRADFNNGLGSGQFAHLAGTTRVLADLEWTYLAGGGNPQWLDYKRYWKCAATETSTITDVAGQENLTCTSITAGTSDPPNGIASFWPGAALADQTGTQGSTLTSIDFTTKFDKTAATVDYTVKLYTRSAPGTATTATAAATASNLVTVADATNFAAGGYASITSNSDPLLILAVSGNTLVLGGFRTWASSASVYPFSVTQKTFTFYSSGNTFSGTPAAGDVGSYTLIPRAANNTTATLIADGPAFQLTISASGAAPSFSAGPTLTSSQTDGHTFGATCTQTATLHLGYYKKGSATPSAANLKAGAGTGSLYHTTAALTASVAGSITSTTLTALVADAYLLVTNGSGDSAIVSFTNLLLAPPATKQFVQATVVSISAISKANPVQITTTGAHGRTSGQRIEVYGVSGMTEINGAYAACTVVDSTHLTLPIDSTAYTTYTSGGSLSWGYSVDAGASTAVATGDVRTIDRVTNPDGLTITVQPDGSYSIAGPVTRRQDFSTDCYSVSANAMIGAAKTYTNNLVPVPPAVVGNFLPAVFVPANQAITSQPISTLATDPQGDTLSVVASGLTSGLSISSGNLVGTSGANAITAVSFTWTNDSGESATAAYNLVTGQVTVPNLSGKTQGDIDSLLSGLYLSATYGQQDDARTAGQPITQVPSAGTLITPPATVSVTLSTGVAPVTPPVIIVPLTAVDSDSVFYGIQPSPLLSPITGANRFDPVEVCSAGANDQPGQVYRFMRLASDSKITDIGILNDANPTNSSYQGGLFLENGKPVQRGADSVLFRSLSLDGVRSTYNSVYSPAIAGVARLANVNKALWQLLGLPADPKQTWIVGMTAVIPGTRGGAIVLRVSYTR